MKKAAKHISQSKFVCSCNISNENRDYLFVHCKSVKKVWGMFQAQIGHNIADNDVKSI